MLLKFYIKIFLPSLGMKIQQFLEDCDDPVREGKVSAESEEEKSLLKIPQE